MVFRLLYLYYLIPSPNSPSAMGTSGCAAIRITIWETPGPRLIPYITRSCTSTLVPERRYSFVTKVLRVSPLKDVGIYDTEVRVKGDKWLEITFFVRLRHRVSRVQSSGILAMQNLFHSQTGPHPVQKKASISLSSK